MGIQKISGNKMKDSVIVANNSNNSERKFYSSKADSFFLKHNIPMWLVILSFIFSLIAICGLLIAKDVIIHKESIVLTFIGILATFVVVSNYVQIKEIKNSHEEFRKEYEELKIEYNYYKNKLMSQDEYVTYFAEGCKILSSQTTPHEKQSYDSHITAVFNGLRALENFLKCLFFDSSLGIKRAISYLEKSVKQGNPNFEIITINPHHIKTTFELLQESKCPYFSSEDKENLKAIAKKWETIFCDKYDKQGGEKR